MMRHGGQGQVQMWKDISFHSHGALSSKRLGHNAYTVILAYRFYCALVKIRKKRVVLVTQVQGSQSRSLSVNLG